MASGVKSDKRVEDGRGMIGGNRLGSSDPSEKVRVGNLHQGFEIGEIMIAEIGNAGVRVASENEVHLTRASSPGAHQRPPPTLVEAVAGSRSAGHGVFRFPTFENALLRGYADAR